MNISISEEEMNQLLKALDLYTFFFIFLIAACFFVLIFLLIMLVRNIRTRQKLKENTQFISEIVTVQENERQRISQELHDTVSQNIKVLMMMERKLLEKSKDDSNSEKIEKIISLEAQNQKQLRTIIQNLAVPELFNIPFKTLIESVCEEFKIQSGIKCTFFVSPEIDLEKFSKNERHNILRIIQEALTNAKNHADPSETSVIFQKRQGKIMIMIFNDGRGFDVANKKDDGNFHFGMSGMEMRAKLLGGKFSIKSSPETGTQVRVELNENNNAL